MDTRTLPLFTFVVGDRPMLMQTVRGWRAACDEVAERLLSDAGVGREPVDAYAVARRLGIEVVLRGTQVGRTRFKRLRGQATLYVKPDSRPERQHWAVAKHLGETVVPRVFAQIGHVGPVQGGLREQVATEMAGRLLLPSRPFLDVVAELDGDVPAIKRRFATASHELVLLNLLRASRATTVTMFDASQTRRRFGNRGGTKPVSEFEFDVWQDVHRLRESADVVDRSSGTRVQCWAMEEADGEQRELMRTTRAAGSQLELGELEGDRLSLV